MDLKPYRGVFVTGLAAVRMTRTAFLGPADDRIACRVRVQHPLAKLRYRSPPSGKFGCTPLSILAGHRKKIMFTLAICLATAGALSLTAIPAEVSRAGVAAADNVLALLQRRSPGERGRGQLADTKPATRAATNAALFSFDKRPAVML